MIRPSEILEKVELKPYTSWLIGGAADYFVLPENEDQLKRAWSWALQNKIPVTFLGGGSNVLISDHGVEGLVIGLKKYSSLQAEVRPGKAADQKQKDFLNISCLSGTSKSELLKVFLKHKLSPSLFLAGIPGLVGGGVYMNAGISEAMTPKEFVEIVDSIEVLRPSGNDFEKLVFLKKDLNWTYRHCEGWKPGFISKIHLSWPLDPDEKVLEKVKEANKVRLSKQPLDLPSCGSVFVNPEGHKAAQLIDQCGLKGFSVGDAEVSMKHANFIVNKANAKASDVIAVIQHVQNVVLEKKAVHLKTEVIVLGRG